jgi:hypothetical protein
MAFAPSEPDIALESPQRGIEERVGEFTRSRGPLRGALAAVAARLVEARSWERLGFARLSDYARERTGLSARQLQDLARTHERLRELPGVERALLDGTLTWTRARLVARAATAADEAVWIGRARGLSADALEREVRAVDRGSLEGGPGSLGQESVGQGPVDEEGHAEELRETVQIRCTGPVRGKWNHARTLARQVAGERLVPWQCAEAIAAEVLSALPVDEELGPLRLGAGRLDAGPPNGRARRNASDAPRSDAAEPADGVEGCERPGAPGDSLDASESGSSERTREADRCASPVAGDASCPKAVAAGAVPSAPPARILELGRGTFALRTRARWRERQESTPPHASVAASSAAAANGAAALPVGAELLVVGLEAADAFELDRRLRHAVALEQRLDAEIGSLLIEVAEQRLHRARGFSTLDAFVRERLGLSPRKARMLLRLERAARRCPALREAYRSAQLSWVRAHALVPIVLAAPRWAPHWIAWAQRITVRRLEADVDRALCEADTAPEVFEATGGLPPEVHSGELRGGSVPKAPSCEPWERTGVPSPGAHCGEVQGGPSPKAHCGEACEPTHGLTPRTRSGAPAVPGRDGSADSAWGVESACGESAASDPFSPSRQIRARHKASDRTPHEPCRFFFTAPPDVARLFRSTLCTVRRALERRTGRLPTEGEAMEAMLDHVFAVWDPEDRERPRAHRVFERDGWRCSAPGCSSYRNLQDHHIVFRSAHGSNALDNRTTLCAWHHLRGVHAGIFGCRGRAPGALRFELGRRRRRRPLLAYRSGDVLDATGSGSATAASSASR